MNFQGTLNPHLALISSSLCLSNSSVLDIVLQIYMLAHSTHQNVKHLYIQALLGSLYVILCLWICMSMYVCTHVYTYAHTRVFIKFHCDMILPCVLPTLFAITITLPCVLPTQFAITITLPYATHTVCHYHYLAMCYPHSLPLPLPCHVLLTQFAITITLPCAAHTVCHYHYLAMC